MGGSGEDRLFGQAGDDKLWGGEGKDLLLGFTARYLLHLTKDHRWRHRLGNHYPNHRIIYRCHYRHTNGRYQFLLYLGFV
jgi:Ca2+-binding RTX toxin-like protein